MDILKVFGANATQFLLALGLSHEAVAVRMVVELAFIISIERVLKNVTRLTMWQVSQALEVRPAELLDEKASKIRS